MVKYMVKRILVGILSLFVLVTVTFFLTRMMPGSPFAAGNVSEKVQEAIEEEYGLNDSVSAQYCRYLGNLLRGDLGISLKKPGVTVAEVIARAWPATMKVGVPAILAAAVLGSVLGILQASAKSRRIRMGIFLGTVLGSTIPNFAAAILLLLIFGVKLNWFPVAGLTAFGNYVLPVIALSMYPTAVITRLMSRTYADEMQKDYVVMAKAKGISKWRITCVHVMRHAWIPVLNYLGPAAAFLVTGSFVVESVFTIPGLGREFVSSIANRDYTLIMGLTIFMGAVVILINLLTDIACAALNPKMRRAYY